MIHTWPKLDIPRTKQMESKILDLPLPFNPVIALNNGSNPLISVLFPYDLKPSIIIDLICILTARLLTIFPQLHYNFSIAAKIYIQTISRKDISYYRTD